MVYVCEASHFVGALNEMVVGGVLLPNKIPAEMWAGVSAVVYSMWAYYGFFFPKLFGNWKMRMCEKEALGSSVGMVVVDWTR